MNCPYCNKKMISGFVQGGREIFFTEQKHKWIFAATDKDVLLTRHHLSAPTRIAYRFRIGIKELIDYASDCE